MERFPEDASVEKTIEEFLGRLPAAGPDSPPPSDTLERVCRRVHVDLLEKKGIRRLRVLSETQFDEVLRELVEAGIQQKLEDLKGDREFWEAMTQELREETRKDYEEQWQAYKQSQEERLKSLEDRLLGLRSAFAGLEGSLQRLSVFLSKVPAAAGRDRE